MTGALAMLRPRRVVLDSGPPGLLEDVAAWVASQTAIAVSRGPAGAGAGTLVVTADSGAAARAIAAGAAVLVAGGAAPEPPDGWVATPIDHDATLLAPPAPALPTTGPLGEPASPAQPTITVIVPIHNAAAELRGCLDALSRNTTAPADLVLVDDASTDPEVERLLDEAAEWPRTRILRNVQNRGFTATVNRGLRACQGDVVVLNSDTEVGPRWLERMRAAATSAAGVGSATACSDNAGAFSLPVLGEPNVVPAGLDADGAARVVAAAAGGRLVETPTANGFCMYLRREMLDDVGPFDEAAFPRGYGEENDLCLRAVARGWRHVVDPGTYVRHVREASFGEEKQALALAARATIDARYPDYTERVRRFVADPGYAAARERAGGALAAAATPRPRVLFVIHEGGGGTPLANLELMAALPDRYECLLLTCDRQTMRLDRMDGGERTLIDRWDLSSPVGVLDFTREDYREIATRVLHEHAIELVHVRHLFKHTFDVPVAAARLGIPVVFSFHDYYFTCPTVHLLDEQDRYCAGQCTPGEGSCRVPDAGLEGLPPLKHAFVHEWREEVQAMLAGVDTFATTSEHVRDVHRRALPAIGDRPFAVIPHGRSLRQTHGLAQPPLRGGPLKILLAGNLAAHKGAGLVREIRRRDIESRLEFHLLGDVPAEFADLGIVHGRYPRAELAARVAEIRPAVMGLFSITAETFSHTISEAWSMGIPVVATDLGAPAERLRQHQGGWLIPHDDPAEALRRLIRVADDPEEYLRQARRADLRGQPTVADMADAYAALYANVLESRRALAAPSGSPRAPARHRRGVRRVCALVSGSGGEYPGSTHVRIVRPHRHPSFARRVATSIRYAADGVASGAEVVLVQRTALPPEHVSALLDAVAERDVPLVVELDDHLLLKGQTDGEYGAHQESLRELLGAAALVTVSTTALAEALQGGGARIEVVPNALDERLFLDGALGPPRGPQPGRGPVRLAYVGSTTHGRDLELLRPVMAELERRAPGRYLLEIVGVQPGDGDGGWFERALIPDEAKAYPRFVRWLRALRPRWDIGLAPLVDDPFNTFKSDLKWLEYTGLGLPVLASDLAPYATIRDGETGRLLADDPAAWADAIEELAASPGLRDEMADAAWSEVTGSRLLRHQVPRLAELLLGIEAAG